jgi:Leucine-rich repeat (LRR) protein
MGEGSWFLVGLLVILLSTAEFTQHKGVFWEDYLFVKGTFTGYICFYQNFDVLSTKTLDPNRKFIDLTNLSLAKNSIRVVERDVFHRLEKLERLVLSGNLICSLDEDIFSNLKSLQQLDLSFNLLSELPDSLFSSQDHLKTLLLQGNKLRTISVPLLTPLISITLLDLSNNQLLCDCELKLSMLLCKDRMLDTEATCQNQVSGNMAHWTQLEFFNNCSEYPVPSVLSKSVTTPYTKLEDRVVAVSSSYLVPLFIVGAVAF